MVTTEPIPLPDLPTRSASNLPLTALPEKGLRVRRETPSRISLVGSGDNKQPDEICLKGVTPKVFIGFQLEFRLDSRFKHAGMTDFG